MTPERRTCKNTHNHVLWGYCIKRDIIEFFRSVKWSKIDSKTVFCGKTDRPDTERGILDKWNKITYKIICTQIKSA